MLGKLTESAVLHSLACQSKLIIKVIVFQLRLWREKSILRMKIKLGKNELLILINIEKFTLFTNSEELFPLYYYKFNLFVA